MRIKHLYFFVAAYFRFWARCVLHRWKPRVIVVTGSSGKTTLFHLIESQLGTEAEYAYAANSALGIPFHILGMPTNVTKRSAWPMTFFIAPFKAFRRVPKKPLYIVEADTDRPGEGAFLGRLLRPEVTLWVSVSDSHAMNFDRLVRSGAFLKPIEAIAFDFGSIVAATQKLAVVDGESAYMMQQVERLKENVSVETVSMMNITDHSFSRDNTKFVINSKKYALPGIHPKEIGISVQLLESLLTYLGRPIDASFEKLEMPPGRSSVFNGVKGTTLIDSTYNTGLAAMTAILNLFAEYPARGTKWVVIGDILEQGDIEALQHERLADSIANIEPDHVVLLGPRTKLSTAPKLQKLLPHTPVVSFESPSKVLRYLQENIQGSETVLFKGGRFLEGVIDELLQEPADSAKLVRREAL